MNAEEKQRVEKIGSAIETQEYSDADVYWLITRLQAEAAEVARLQQEVERFTETVNRWRARAEAAEATAERERERAQRAESDLGQMTANAELERLDKEKAEVRIESLEGCVREMRTSLDNWAEDNCECPQCKDTESIIARADSLLSPSGEKT